MQLQLQGFIFLPGPVVGGASPPIPTNGLITESSENFITEDGDRMIQE